MDSKLLAFYVFITFVIVIGIALGYFVKAFLIARQKGNLEEKLSKMKVEAQNEVASLMERTNKEAEKITTKAYHEAEEVRQDAHQTQERINKKEASQEQRQDRLDTQEQKVDQQKENIEKKEKELESVLKEEQSKLESIAGYDKKQAYVELQKQIEEESQEALASRQAKLEQENNELLETKAKGILAAAIQRYGNSVDNDIMSTHVNLADDEMKGKIIGKEGRNIKAFEQASGVQLLVDDTPGQISISSYDPIRRAVAKTALEVLLKDGRIQPARIEEVVEKAKSEVNEMVTKRGREAAVECEVHNLQPELLNILGRLYFRYSFGQNVLQHSIEMSHIAKVLASEIGADVYVARAGALLHDIGKAVDHEVEGSHVEIGRRILQKYGVDDTIIKAMQAHHEEYPYETIESRIVQTADSISGQRPGARNDNAEMYIQKLEGLERIAKGIKGVQDAYAVSAGREVRIFVNPKAVNDYQAAKIAKKIAKQVEEELKYPGEIKVNVIREKRSIEFAR